MKHISSDDYRAAALVHHNSGKDGGLIAGRATHHGPGLMYLVADYDSNGLQRYDAPDDPSSGKQ